MVIIRELLIGLSNGGGWGCEEEEDDDVEACACGGGGGGGEVDDVDKEVGIGVDAAGGVAIPFPLAEALGGSVEANPLFGGLWLGDNGPVGVAGNETCGDVAAVVVPVVSAPLAEVVVAFDNPDPVDPEVGPEGNELVATEGFCV